MAQKNPKIRKMRHRHTKKYRELNREDDSVWYREKYFIKKAMHEQNSTSDPLWPEDQYTSPGPDSRLSARRGEPTDHWGG